MINPDDSGATELLVEEVTPQARTPGRAFGTQALSQWITKGGLAVLDQGLSSGANFLVNILLARWLSPEEYGAFAVALSIFYLLGGLHTAVLTEPMMVFGAGKYREHFRKYLGMLLYSHWIVSGIIALLFGAAAFVMARLGSPTMVQALAGLAIASPFLLLLWLARRAAYVEMRPRWAVVGSGVNFVVLLGGVFILAGLGLLSIFASFVLLGAAATVASLILILQLRPRMAGFGGNPSPAMMATSHWEYGKWSVFATLAYSLSGQVVLFLVPLYLGLEESASVAAVMNIYRPPLVAIQAIALLILPRFSLLISRRQEHVWRQAKQASIILGAIMGSYALLVTLSAKSIFNIIYSGKYSESGVVVGMFGVAYVFSTITVVWQVLIKAMENTKLVGLIQATSAVLVVIISIPFMRFMGVNGAVASMVLSYGVVLIMTIKSALKITASIKYFGVGASG